MHTKQSYVNRLSFPRIRKTFIRRCFLAHIFHRVYYIIQSNLLSSRKRDARITFHIIISIPSVRFPWHRRIVLPLSRVNANTFDMSGRWMEMPLPRKHVSRRLKPACRDDVFVCMHSTRCNTWHNRHNTHIQRVALFANNGTGRGEDVQLENRVSTGGSDTWQSIKSDSRSLPLRRLQILYDS